MCRKCGLFHYPTHGKLKKPSSQMWSENELNILRESYSSTPVEKMLDLLPNRSRQAIKFRARQLKIRQNVGVKTIHRNTPPWNKGLHGDPRSKSLFKKGHPFYGQKAWTEEEIQILKQAYANTSPNELLTLLPKRSEDATNGMVHRLGLCKNKKIGLKNRGIGIKRYYQEHPEAKAKLRHNGLKLAQSPYHHRRKVGEYTLPPESRKQVSATLIRTYKEYPEIKKAACKALERGRLKMGLGKGPTEPERKVTNLLLSLNANAIPQYRINGFFVDSALLKQKLAILVDGCFWHCCPTHFPMAATRSQQHNLVVDKKRDKALKKVGWRVLHIWEHEIDAPATLEHLEKEVMSNAYPAD